jgi:hypothetical protein
VDGSKANDSTGLGPHLDDNRLAEQSRRLIENDATDGVRCTASATEISKGHASWMPSSAREVVLQPADAAALLDLGFLIKVAKLSTTNSR